MRHAFFALTLLASPVVADEVEYITPRIPTEAEKIEALKLGFILNNFSMSRPLHQGSIDVSLYQLPPRVVPTDPIDPVTNKKKGDRK